MRSKFILNPNGQSLVQTLVSVAIMGFLVMAMTSMFSYQSTEMKSLKERLAAADFQQQLTRSFADGTLCTALLTDAAFSATPLTFIVPAGGATASTPLSQNLNFTTIPVNVASPTTSLVTAGQAVSAISTSLIAASSPTPTFQLTRIVGSSNGTNGVYSANFQVNFNPATLVRAVHPVLAQVILQTSSVGGAQTVTACQGGGSGTCPVGQVMAGVSASGGLNCIPGSYYGGTFQTVICNGSCRIGNPLTGGCSCPTGYTAQHTDDFTNGDCGPDAPYGGGMMLYVCYR